MPLYMDVHMVPGVSGLAVAEAHRLDMAVQEEHGCKCMTYWVDEKRGSVFCLIEAPGKEAVEEMHRQAHGLIPNKIIEVKPDLVESFLGRIYDPEKAEITPDGLKIFTDPSFRIIMVIRMADEALQQHTLGRDKARETVSKQVSLVRHHIAASDGREIEHNSNSFIVSFAAASRALACAQGIQDSTMQENPSCTLQIGIHAGEPVANSDAIFGEVIQMADYLCSIAKNFQVVISAEVKELVSKDVDKNNNKLLAVLPQEAAFLNSLYNTLNAHIQDAEFSVDDYCKAMAMSKSQLYRKTLELTGLSPNLLIKEFRLQKAKDLMKKQHASISQVTFESGFSSPSYFTKCFKKKYGILPMTYLDLLH